jgi:hypothetical protein
MPPTLLAQATAVDMSTPFTLAVVLLLLGVAAAFGAMQMQASNMKEQITELRTRVDKRDEHAAAVDTRPASMSTKLDRVDVTVDKIAAILTADRRTA